MAVAASFAVERLIPYDASWNHDQADSRRDRVHATVNETLLVFSVAAIPLLAAAVPPARIWPRHWPFVVQVLIAILAADLGITLVHLASHKIGLLWRFHAVHHSIEEMDWLAAGRLHPLDSAFTTACFLTPLIVLGYDGGVFAGATVFITALAIFQHANVRLRFPGLRWVINTPQWHHWHHSAHREALNKNFGLPVVDLLFGTAHLPKGVYATEFGIPDPVPEASYARQMVYPFTREARGAVG